MTFKELFIEKRVASVLTVYRFLPDNERVFLARQITESQRLLFDVANSVQNKQIIDHDYVYRTVCREAVAYEWMSLSWHEKLTVTEVPDWLKDYEKDYI